MISYVGENPTVMESWVRSVQIPLTANGKIFRYLSNMNKTGITTVGKNISCPSPFCATN